MHSAVHSVLRNDDLLSEVVQHLKAGCNISTIVQMIRVCKGFAEPALDVLWKDLDSISPLVRVLVDGVAYPSVLPFSDATQGRFHSYARRVQSLTIREGSDERHLSVIRRLAIYARGEPLLPSLLTLNMLIQPTSFGAIIFPFLSPSLHTFVLEVEHFVDSQETSCFLRPVASNLHDIVEAMGPAWLPYLNNIPANLSQALDVLPVTGPFVILSICARATCLTTLQVDLMGMNTANIKLCNGFPALTDLTLFGTPLQATAFTSVLSTSYLRIFAFSIELLDLAHPDYKQMVLEDYRSMLVALHDMAAESLRGVKLTISAPNDLSPSLMAIMDPILGCHGLEDLYIDIAFPEEAVSITDEDVHRMAVSWPRIECIDVLGREGTHSPSVNSLIDFARHCRSLKVLKLPWIHPWSSPPSAAEWSSVLPCALSQLVLTHRKYIFSPLIPIHRIRRSTHSSKDPYPIARLLVHLFPSLIEVEYGREGTRSWTRISKILAMLRANEQ